MKEKGVFDVVNNTTPRRSYFVAIINSLTYAQAFFFTKNLDCTKFIVKLFVFKIGKKYFTKKVPIIYHHRLAWTVQIYFGKIALFGMHYNLKIPSKKELTNQTFFCQNSFFFASIASFINSLKSLCTHFNPCEKKCVSRCKYTNLQTYFCRSSSLHILAVLLLVTVKWCILTDQKRS